MQAHGRARNARKLPREFSCAPEEGTTTLGYAAVFILHLVCENSAKDHSAQLGRSPSHANS